MDTKALEKAQLSLCIVDMILYIADSEYAIRELLEGIRTFSKKAGYKINIQK